MKWTFPNLRLFLFLAVITGGIYPLAVTLVSLIFFPHQAHGSLIRNERGEIIASELVAQPFISAKYFWPRPSAGEYATMPSGASNLSWTSGKLVRTVAERRAALLKAHNLPEKTPVPADMLFASGSGLEPFISPEAAELQLNRVAFTRGVRPRWNSGGKRSQRDDSERRAGYIVPDERDVIDRPGPENILAEKSSGISRCLGSASFSGYRGGFLIGFLSVWPNLLKNRDNKLVGVRYVAG